MHYLCTSICILNSDHLVFLASILPSITISSKASEPKPPKTLFFCCKHCSFLQEMQMNFNNVKPVLKSLLLNSTETWVIYCSRSLSSNVSLRVVRLMSSSAALCPVPSVSHHSITAVLLYPVTPLTSGSVCNEQ